nr:hypothetical protein [Lachnospiraceae bacterium]
MNLYQSGYFRVGKQGVNAGWIIVAPSAGMSQTAQEGFRGIASNLTDLKGNSLSSPTAMGVFSHDRFVYMIHVNYVAKGEDARGVVYTHSYCMNYKEYFDLLKTPEVIFGIREDAFPAEYDESISSYPVVASLPYDRFEVNEILGKYNLSPAAYSNLIMAAISGIDHLTDPLCITGDFTNNNINDVYREIMYIIMKKLPYHLRAKARLYSGAGANADIYFSEKADGNNVFDLRTGEATFDNSRVYAYDYTKIYTNNIPEDKIDGIFNSFAAFVDNSIDVPMNQVNSGHINAAYNKSFVNSIDAQRAVSLLDSFLRFNLKKTPETYSYLRQLLISVNDGGQRITSEITWNKLRSRYYESDNKDFDDELIETLLRETTHLSEDESFMLLSDVYEKKADKEAFREAFKNKNPKLFDDWMMKGYLPAVITDLSKARAYIIDNKALMSSKPEYYYTVLKLSKNIFERQLKKARTLGAKSDAYTEAYDVVQNIQGQKEAEQGYINDVYDKLVNAVGISDFAIGEANKFDEFIRLLDGGRNEASNNELKSLIRLMKSTQRL